MGVLEYLESLHPPGACIGMLGGLMGLLHGWSTPITRNSFSLFRNQGGLDFLCRTTEHFSSAAELHQCMHTIAALQLDGLVLLGGASAVSSAALLTEALVEFNCSTCVVCIPMTVDNGIPFIEACIGHDTVCRVFNSIIGSLMMESRSSKCWYFIRVSGKSLSHTTAECALDTHPTLVLINEEIEQKRMGAMALTHLISDIVETRARLGLHYGTVLLPDSLLAHLPEMHMLITEVDACFERGFYSESEEGIELLRARLTPWSAALFSSLPKNIQWQLAFSKDQARRVDLTAIDTEVLLKRLVERELARRKSIGAFRKGQFLCKTHFLAYQGRSAAPTNFDSDLGFSYGFGAAVLIDGGFSGYIVQLSNLLRPAAEWLVSAVPLTCLIDAHPLKQPAASSPVLFRPCAAVAVKPRYQFFGCSSSSRNGEDNSNSSSNGEEKSNSSSSGEDSSNSSSNGEDSSNSSSNGEDSNSSSSNGEDSSNSGSNGEDSSSSSADKHSSSYYMQQSCCRTAAATAAAPPPRQAAAAASSSSPSPPPPRQAAADQQDDEGGGDSAVVAVAAHVFFPISEGLLQNEFGDTGICAAVPSSYVFSDQLQPRAHIPEPEANTSNFNLAAATGAAAAGVSTAAGISTTTAGGESEETAARLRLQGSSNGSTSRCSSYLREGKVNTPLLSLHAGAAAAADAPSMMNRIERSVCSTTYHLVSTSTLPSGASKGDSGSSLLPSRCLENDSDAAAADSGLSVQGSSSIRITAVNAARRQHQQQQQQQQHQQQQQQQHCHMQQQQQQRYQPQQYLHNEEQQQQRHEQNEEGSVTVLPHNNVHRRHSVSSVVGCGPPAGGEESAASPSSSRRSSSSSNSRMNCCSSSSTVESSNSSRRVECCSSSSRRIDSNSSSSRVDSSSSSRRVDSSSSSRRVDSSSSSSSRKGRRKQQQQQQQHTGRGSRHASCCCCRSSNHHHHHSRRRRRRMFSFSSTTEREWAEGKKDVLWLYFRIDVPLQKLSLEGGIFRRLALLRSEWALGDAFSNPGAVQYEGAASDSRLNILSLPSLNPTVQLKRISQLCQEVKALCSFRAAPAVLGTAEAMLAGLTEALRCLSKSEKQRQLQFYDLSHVISQQHFSTKAWLSAAEALPPGGLSGPAAGNTLDLPSSLYGPLLLQQQQQRSSLCAPHATAAAPAHPFPSNLVSTLWASPSDAYVSLVQQQAATAAAAATTRATAQQLYGSCFTPPQCDVHAVVDDQHARQQQHQKSPHRHYYHYY